MKIIGHGICGPNERYLERTLKEFQRLCDDTIILLNNAGKKEEALIKKYGFKIVKDNREWGTQQNIIKEEFIRKHVAKLNPDYALTLDMDEVFEEGFGRKDLEALTKWHSAAFYFVQHWDDEKHHNPDFSFWSVRFWRFDKPFDFLKRPLQCGLVPKWALNHCSYAPHYIKHFGLMRDRQRKIDRYEKYDPESKYLPSYYEKLKTSKNKQLFTGLQLKDEVAKYGDQIKKMAKEKDTKYYLFRNPAGTKIDVPERHAKKLMGKEGFELLSKEPIDLLDKQLGLTDEPETQEVNELQCIICGFEAKTKGGLSAHKRRHA